MKKYLPVLLIMLLLIPINVLGEESIFINFEEGQENMISSGAQVVCDEANNNSYLLITSEGEEAYVHKSFRNMQGTLIAGFKIKISNTDALIKYFFVNDNSQTVNVLSFGGGSVMCGETVLCGYTENEEINVLMFVNCDKREIVFDINGTKSKPFPFGALKEGISGVAARCISERKAEVALDNIYCYAGTTVLSEYEMMSDKQKSFSRTAEAAVYSEYCKGAILDGKKYPEAAGAVRIGDRVYLPLRSTLEAAGGTVEWENGITTVLKNDTSYTFNPGSAVVGVNGADKALGAPPMLINSAMYLPKDAYSSLFGMKIHSDIGGIYMAADKDSFIKSSSEKELYQVLVKVLTGDDYILSDGGSYSVIPADFSSFHMQPLSAAGVSASSAPQENDGYGPEKTVDGDLSTRWSSDENGAELIIDIGSITDIDGAALAFFNGTIRRAHIEIYTSRDGRNWNLALNKCETSGKTDLREIYPFKASARYVKYKGYGTTAGVWNSVTEFCVMKER